MTIATTGGPPNKASARTTPSSLRIVWHAVRGPGLVVDMNTYASIAMARMLVRPGRVHLLPCLSSPEAHLQARTPGRPHLPRGVLLGTVELVDCVRDSEREWAMADRCHRQLVDRQPFETPIPATGRLGLWTFTV